MFSPLLAPKNAMALYKEFYGCAETPFNVAPDPRFLYLTPSHREALAQLLYAVEHRKGIVVLTGEVGTGKTLLLRAFLEETAQRLRVAYLPIPPRTVPELFATIGATFGIALGNTAPTDELTRFLLDNSKRGETSVLLFDEAQQLSDEVLEEIRLLSNLQTGSEKLSQLVFAAQPEFDATLERPELRALRQRIVLRCSLKALKAAETEAYIATRLRLAGASESPFTYDACAAVYRYSQGIPRLINVLCDNAMLTGYALQKREIARELIISAAADLHLHCDTRAPTYVRFRERARRMNPFSLGRRFVMWATIAMALVLIGASSLGGASDFRSAPRRLVQAVDRLVEDVTGRQPFRESGGRGWEARARDQDAPTLNPEGLYDE